MNWDRFQTLLLAVLVGLSLVLTYNLWTYKYDFSSLENTGGYVESAISSSGSRLLSDVIHPDKAILEEDGAHYGLASGTALTEMFTEVTRARYSKVRSQGEDMEKQKTEAAPRDNGITLVFPTPVPVTLFGEMLQGDNEDESGASEFSMVDAALVFDRAVFYEDEDDETTDMIVIFKRGEQSVATARVHDLSFADLETFYQDDRERYVPVQLKDRTVFIPDGPVSMNKVYYGYDWININTFKRALFSNPDIVERQGDYLTSGTQLLKQSHYTIKYFDGEPSSKQDRASETDDAHAYVKESFTDINSRSGWTDAYMLFDAPLPEDGKPDAERSVVFRLMVNGGGSRYPVFSSVSGQYPYKDPGTILLTWKNGAIYEYARSQMKIQEYRGDEHVQPLPPGEKVLQELESHPAIQMKAVEDLRLGYHMDYPPSARDFVGFDPGWFVKYEGSWQSFDDLTETEERDMKGENTQ